MGAGTGEQITDSSDQEPRMNQSRTSHLQPTGSCFLIAAI
jgi:hypothetical protein